MRKRIMALMVALLFAVSVIGMPFAAAAEGSTAEATQTVKITVKSNWYDATGKNVYKGDKPSVAYEVYEGEYSASKKPVSISYPASTGTTTINLKDTDKIYTIHEVFGADKKGFEEAKDQYVDLKLNQGLTPVFNHTYVGEKLEAATLSLDATVTLDDKEPANGAFSFVLADANSGAAYQVKNNVGKTVTFDALSFDKEGKYYYTISEQAGTDSNINYDKSKYALTVEVAKDKTGKKLVAEATITKAGVAYKGTPSFSNASKVAPTETTVTVTANFYNADGKTYYMGTLPSVSYEVYEGDIATNEKPIATYALKDGTDTMSFKVSNDNKQYTIREVFTKNVTGFTTAADQKVDLDKGTDLKLAFNHSYKAETTVTVTANFYNADGKTYYMGTLPSVSYEVYEGDIATNEKPIATYALKDGTDTMSFKVSNDNKQYTIREVFTKNVTGFTTAADQKVDLDKGTDFKLAFNHSYKAETVKAASVALKGLVSFDGKTPSNGKFSFTLTDTSTGTILQTKSNVAKNITFDALTFDKEGTYNYKVVQKAGSDSTITYDDTVYTIAIKVTNDNGTLKATQTVLADGKSYTGNPVFVNLTKAGTATTTKVSVSVTKVWKNDKTSSRPSSVSVQLYKNGSAYGNAVRLTSSNSWKYIWSNLDSSYTWTVNETAVPSGYTKSVTNSGNSWTITNTASSATTKASTTSNSTTPTTGDERGTKTMMIVAVLLLGAMVCLGVAYFTNKRKK